MTHDEHPYPESAALRFGPPTVAAVLLGVVIVSMFAILPGLAQTLTVAIAAGLGVPLMIVRSVQFRRAARAIDGPMRWHQFVFFWGTTAGFSFVVDSNRGPEARLVHLGIWFLGAAVVVGIGWLNETAARPRWWPTGRARRERDTGVPEGPVSDRS